MTTWISTEEAMKLLGVKRARFFERMKRGEFETRLAGLGANGKSKREITLECLPTVAQERFYQSATANAQRIDDQPEQTPAVVSSQASALSKLFDASEEQLAEKTRDAEDLQKIIAAKNPKLAKEDVARRRGVSVRTVNRWLKAFQRGGTAYLLRKPRRDRGGSKVTDPRMDALIKIEWLKTHRPTVADIYRKFTWEFEMKGLPPPDYKTFLRRTKDIPPDVVALHRGGEREYSDRWEYITQRKRPEWPRMLLDFDHHKFDVPVVFENGDIGRPWLTAGHDTNSGDIPGYHITRESRSAYPGAGAIALAMRHAILPKDDKAWPSLGVFDVAYFDLGKDYRSKQIRAVCADLGIKIVHTRPYLGRAKPIERFFGTLESALKKLPGYCGKDVLSNPERQRLGAPRSLESRRGELLTIDEFILAVHNWIVHDFHFRPSQALHGLSPIGALEEAIKKGWRPREIANERALDLLLMRRTEKKVMRFGIQMLGRRYWADELTQFINQTVEVCWDDSKVGELIVYKGDRFICKATNKELLAYDADYEDVKAEREIRRKQKQSVTQRMADLVAKAQHPNELARAQAKRRHDDITREEREKIAINARAPGVTVLLPKYAGATKKLALAERSKPREDKPASKSEAPAGDGEDLKNMEEIFPRRELVPDCLDLDKSECSGCGKYFDTLEMNLCFRCSNHSCRECDDRHDCSNRPEAKDSDA